MLKREIGQHYRFNYPDFGTPDTYPDHTKHSGQVVEIIAHDGRLAEEEAECGEEMYRILATDGWKGYAWASELEEIDTVQEG